LKSCLLCPKGTRCRGYVLHTLIFKLYNAMSEDVGLEDIVRELSREDMLAMAEQGAKARITCWSKGFVMVVARKVAEIAKASKDDIQMKNGIERMIVQMDGLFGKLPKGISIDLSELTVEIFNHAIQALEEEGIHSMIPASVVGKACTALSIKNRK